MYATITWKYFTKRSYEHGETNKETDFEKVPCPYNITHNTMDLVWFLSSWSKYRGVLC